MTRIVLAISIWMTGSWSLAQQDVETTTTTIKTTTTKGAQEVGETQPTESASEHFVIRNQFGPSECKIPSLIKNFKKELVSECKEWKKEQKSDLGKKYNTGTCTPKREKCGPGIYKVSVEGTVHYSR